MITASMPYYVYKKVLQLFLIKYDPKIENFKSMLNILLNWSKNEFDSFRAKPYGNSNFSKFFQSYDHEKDDFLIAGNALLTLLRSNALKLNLKAKRGHKVLIHNPQVIKVLRNSILNETIE